MTTWSARSLCNTAYAYLAEQADAFDRVAAPVFLSAGVKSKEVQAMNRRNDLDLWLESPNPAQVANEQALVKYLST